MRRPDGTWRRPSDMWLLALLAAVILGAVLIAVVVSTDDEDEREVAASATAGQLATRTAVLPATTTRAGTTPSAPTTGPATAVTTATGPVAPQTPATPLGDSTPRPATSTPAAATPTGEARRTGVASLDTVIATVRSRDASAIQRLIRLTAAPCGPQQGPGSPPACPAGVANGTPVEVLPITTCEGELRPANAVGPTLASLAPAIRELYAVFRPPTPYLSPAQGEYVAVFERRSDDQPGARGIGFLVAGSNIVGIWQGCQATPAQVIPQGVQLVLPPA